MQKKIAGLLAKIEKLLGELPEGEKGPDIGFAESLVEAGKAVAAEEAADKAKAEGESASEDRGASAARSAELEELLALIGGLPERRADAVLETVRDPFADGAPTAAPFPAHVRKPSPIRAGSAPAPAADYGSMSSAKFRELKRLLKKAAGDGKRIKL